jgi:LacI family transcriptional regulator
LITLKELAAKCGVSIATVSNILNGKANVSDKTKERIMKIIKETGYRPNYMARGLRAIRTRTLGLIVDDLTAFSTPSIIEGIMQYCDDNNYRVIFENLRVYTKFKGDKSLKQDFKNAVNAAFQEMLSIKVDGIIYVAAHSRIVDYIPKELPVPVVVSYALSSDKKHGSVTIADEDAAYQMTDFLIQKGYKKIAVISGSSGNIHEENRINGYKKALEKNSLSYKSKYIIPANWDRESGYEAAKKLPFNEIDAVFCFNDAMAAGVYDFLKEMGKAPGKDIGVAGFDNREISAYIDPPLTTMEIPLEEIGRISADLIVKKINGTEEKSEEISVPCRLIIRKSIF